MKTTNKGTGIKVRSNHRHYYRWKAMKRRCYNANHPDYHRYGGRGIRVCKEWLDFQAFAAWADSTYKEGMALDRTNNHKKYRGYSPENCRWVTHTENIRNSEMTQSRRDARRNNMETAKASPNYMARMLEANSKPVICATNGVTYPSASEAARSLGIDRRNISNVIKGRRNHIGGYKFTLAKPKPSKIK